MYSDKLWAWRFQIWILLSTLLENFNWLDVTIVINVCTACYYTYDSTKNQTNGVNKTDKIKDLNYFEEPYLNSLNPEALKLYKESYCWISIL